MSEQARFGEWTAYPAQAPVTGDLRVMRQVQVPRLDRVTDLYAWLPPGYDDDGGRRYPVVYFHDGGNLFDPALAHGGVTWAADRALSALAATGLEAIAIGVPCSATARGEEYTPYPHPDLGGGHAAAYVDFLVDDLKPEVDRSLRTLAGPADTLVAGSSLGGVVSMHCWLTRPDVFGAAGVFSPAFWWPGAPMLDDVRQRLFSWPVEQHQRVYLDVGGREQPDNPRIEAAYVRDAEEVLGWLREAGVPVRYVFDSQAVHHETAWALRLPEALRWLLSGYAVPLPTGEVDLPVTSDSGS
jgi:predicted alpha/beta superfamily hydrolase